MPISVDVCIIHSWLRAGGIVCLFRGAPGDDIAARQPMAEIRIRAALGTKRAVFGVHRLFAAAGALGFPAFGRDRQAHDPGLTSGRAFA